MVVRSFACLRFEERRVLPREADLLHCSNGRSGLALRQRELDRLADHDLRDLRIDRSDISRVAWSEARRRSRGGEP